MVFWNHYGFFWNRLHPSYGSRNSVWNRIWWKTLKYCDIVKWLTREHQYISRDHNQSWSIKTDFSNKTFFPNGLWGQLWRMSSRSRTLRESQNQRKFDQNLRFSSYNVSEKNTEPKTVNFARYTTQYKFKPGQKTGSGAKSNPFLPCLRSLLPDDGAGRCSLSRLKQKGNRQ